MTTFPNRLEMVRSFTPNTGVEVGVLNGDFSAELLTIPSIERLVLVDAWKHFEGEYEKDPANVDQGGQDMRYEAVFQRFKNEPRVDILRMESETAAQLFLRPFDFVFLDGDHTFAGVWRDLMEWSLLTETLYVHDYTSCQAAKDMGFGVVEAVDEFCRAMQWHPLAVTLDEWPTIMLTPQ